MGDLEAVDLAVVGFSEEELKDLLAKDEDPEALVNPVTRVDDVWLDRAAPADLRRLMAR